MRKILLVLSLFIVNTYVNAQIIKTQYLSITCFDVIYNNENSSACVAIDNNKEKYFILSFGNQNYYKGKTLNNSYVLCGWLAYKGSNKTEDIPAYMPEEKFFLLYDNDKNFLKNIFDKLFWSHILQPNNQTFNPKFYSNNIVFEKLTAEKVQSLHLIGLAQEYMEHDVKFDRIAYLSVEYVCHGMAVKNKGKEKGVFLYKYLVKDKDYNVFTKYLFIVVDDDGSVKSEVCSEWIVQSVYEKLMADYQIDIIQYR